MSQIITFYSYKGGVGRSMALANVATLLSKWGKKVLMIDWDLEAPGLENFFKEPLGDTDWSQQKGVLDWLYAQQNKEEVKFEEDILFNDIEQHTQQNKEEIKWQDWVVSFKTSVSTTDLDLLYSGSANSNYSDLLRDFNVGKFYDEHDGGQRIEKFREELLATYDYVLIDSRTGVTDFGGICTIQMPDILVMPFSPTEQGLAGTQKIAQRILDSHQKLPFDRFRLLICPVPSRFDSTTEFKESRDWLDKSAEELEWLYEEWLPTNIKLNEFLQIIKIPYISYFSFGEKLPVIEQGVSDPAGLGYAYENLAMMLAKGLDEADTFIEQRDTFLQQVSGQEIKEPQNSYLGFLNIGDAIRQVRIFISYTKADADFKNMLAEKIEYNFPQKRIQFFDSKLVTLGQSISKNIENKVLHSDIVIIIVSKNYIIFRNNASIDFRIAPEIKDELEVIKSLNKEIVIPMYLNIESKKIKMPMFLADRNGIDIKGNDIGKLIDDALINLMPTISQVVKRKDLTHIVV